MRTIVEDAVVAAWARSLGIDDLRPGDNFFALGGHSLIALRMLFTVREKLDVDVPLQALFDTNDLADFCQHVERLVADRNDHQE